jgi:VanZ family protein
MQPINPADPASPSWDEVLGRFSHAGEYAVLGLLAARAIAWKGRAKPIQLFTAWAGSALYGLSDEIHQIYVPGRAFQLGDLALDMIGAFLGIFLYSFIQRRFVSGQ